MSAVGPRSMNPTAMTYVSLMNNVLRGGTHISENSCAHPSTHTTSGSQVVTFPPSSAYHQMHEHSVNWGVHCVAFKALHRNVDIRQMDLVYITADILLAKIHTVDREMRNGSYAEQSLAMARELFRNHKIDIDRVLGSCLWLPAIGSTNWVERQLESRNVKQGYFGWDQFMKATAGCDPQARWVIRFPSGEPLAVPVPHNASWCSEQQYNTRQECEMAIMTLDPQVEEINGALC